MPLNLQPELHVLTLAGYAPWIAYVEMQTGFVCQCKDGYAEDTKGDCEGKDKDISNMGRDTHFVITIWLRDIMLVS